MRGVRRRCPVLRPVTVRRRVGASLYQMWPFSPSESRYSLVWAATQSVGLSVGASAASSFTLMCRSPLLAKGPAALRGREILHVNVTGARLHPTVFGGDNRDGQ